MEKQVAYIDRYMVNGDTKALKQMLMYKMKKREKKIVVNAIQWNLLPFCLFFFSSLVLFDVFTIHTLNSYTHTQGKRLSIFISRSSIFVQFIFYFSSMFLFHSLYSLSLSLSLSRVLSSCLQFTLARHITAFDSLSPSNITSFSSFCHISMGLLFVLVDTI